MPSATPSRITCSPVCRPWLVEKAIWFVVASMPEMASVTVVVGSLLVTPNRLTWTPVTEPLTAMLTNTGFVATAATRLAG